MDYLAFYRQINKADNMFIEISRAFNILRRKTEDFYSRLEELATEAEKIDSKKECEMFNYILTFYSGRLYEISEQCDKFSGELDEARHNDFVYMVGKAEEMAKEEKKPV